MYSISFASHPLAAFALAGLMAGATLLGTAPSARAGGALPPGAQALREAVGSFRITNDFFQRDHALSLDLAQDPCAHGRRPTLTLELAQQVGEGKLGMDQAIQQFGAQPGMAALLAKHGLSARDAFVGAFAMMAALARVMPAPPGAASSGPDTPTIRANAAFLKAHMAEQHAYGQKVDAIARQRIAANGGRLPACERSAFEHAPSAR